MEEGMKRARGRPPTPETLAGRVVALRGLGRSWNEIARATGLGRTTVRRLYKKRCEKPGPLIASAQGEG
jgi:DNA invertase Pin-like site-specific DNA recombinase